MIVSKNIQNHPKSTYTTFYYSARLVGFEQDQILAKHREVCNHWQHAIPAAERSVHPHIASSWGPGALIKWLLNAMPLKSTDLHIRTSIKFDEKYANICIQ